jgi:DNA-binding MarR family transcriptional regulator
MNRALKILDIFLKIQECPDVFRHKQDGLLDEISLTEVHCIDCIGTIDHPNVTKISGHMSLSRAGISKISKRLLRKGLIESYREPDNNKEIYFRLTGSGRSFYDKHKKIHNEARQEWLTFFERYDDDERSAILRFFTDLDDLFRDGPAGRPEKEE